jgi:hypothetical protein
MPLRSVLERHQLLFDGIKGFQCLSVVLDNLFPPWNWRYPARKFLLSTEQP